MPWGAPVASTSFAGPLRRNRHWLTCQVRSSYASWVYVGHPTGDSFFSLHTRFRVFSRWYRYGRLQVFYVFLANIFLSLSTLELKIRSCKVEYCCPYSAICKCSSTGFLSVFLSCCTIHSMQHHFDDDARRYLVRNRIDVNSKWVPPQSSWIRNRSHGTAQTSVRCLFKLSFPQSRYWPRAVL